MITKSLHTITALTVVLLAALLSGCGETVNNNRIPAMPVDINLHTPGLWNTYGVGGIGMYRIFRKEANIPSDFPWTAATYTGYGGVLVVGVDAAANFGDQQWPYMPMAYDMSCPVEAEPNVVVYVDEIRFEAVCPVCKSRYTLYSGGGPVDGPAVALRYGLEPYNCIGTPWDGFIIVRRK